MKQMIKNHREIESLEDFVYYDKSTGKIVIKKPLDLANPSPTIYEVEDITDISSSLFESLKVGDVISLNEDGDISAGIVSYSDGTLFNITFVTGGEINIFRYEYDSETGWQYSDMFVHKLGTKLYKHILNIEPEEHSQGHACYLTVYSTYEIEATNMNTLCEVLKNSISCLSYADDSDSVSCIIGDIYVGTNNNQIDLVGWNITDGESYFNSFSGQDIDDGQLSDNVTPL